MIQLCLNGKDCISAVLLHRSNLHLLWANCTFIMFSYYKLHSSKNLHVSYEEKEIILNSVLKYKLSKNRLKYFSTKYILLTKINIVVRIDSEKSIFISAFFHLSNIEREIYIDIFSRIGLYDFRLKISIIAQKSILSLAIIYDFSKPYKKLSYKK
ncbi:LOW QUALITY PROTEIN: putative multidrug resistance-associated protein lethal(2)03659 [Vespula maculifrons]|uniref:Multidrug resistance-associated protein lethal(2)03659 n=1 Tax=Vespula maculifrons TaxID=7453 RepID=A0ABD2D2T6_VESMC